MIDKDLNPINMEALCRREFYKSPASWGDQVLYFLMLDRFSDGREDGFLDIRGNRTSGTTPLYRKEDYENAIKTPEEAQKWRESGAKWVGGTLKGLTSKIGYLKRLGVTALWVSPLFKQVAFKETYHGYGIQNFLDVDPHFGTREDLREMVKTAHENEIYVILDIIFNHSGDVFQYRPETDEPGTHSEYIPFWNGNTYDILGFNNPEGNPTIKFKAADPKNEAGIWPDGAVWPREFQDPAVFTRKGAIRNWDNYPEYLEGDFFDLKDITLGGGTIDRYRDSKALRALCDIYQFWIAYADIDGYRIDTVKHMDPGAVRFVAGSIHEFAQSIGKENFYLIGEITGGRNHAFHILEITGIDAALGIDDIPDKLEYLVKGFRNPREYFGLFRNSTLVDKDSHTWFNNKVVTMFDDHDQVRRGENKARFCADGYGPKTVLNALALNVTTMGIPCIYYGSEQGFDGRGDNDRYIREAMFGGAFGAFRSKGRHFFNEETPTYREVAKILEIRKKEIALRRGRQYLRPISEDGVHFGLPEMIGNQIRSIIPWSRIFAKKELLILINNDCEHTLSAWITIDNGLHQTGDTMTCIYSARDKESIGKQVIVEERNGKSVKITAPPCEFAIYE